MIKGFLEVGSPESLQEQNKKKSTAKNPLSKLQRMHPPFASFRNPFAAKTQMSLQELVEYSFSALESLGCELGIERHEDQTPNEFSQAMAEHIIAFRPIHTSTRQALQFGRIYALLAKSKLRLRPAGLLEPT